MCSENMVSIMILRMTILMVMMCYSGAVMVMMTVWTAVMRLDVRKLPLGHSVGTMSGSVPVVTSVYPGHFSVTARMIARI